MWSSIYFLRHLWILSYANCLHRRVLTWHSTSWINHSHRTLHQLFWIILSSKKGAVGCECQVDSLLDQSFYMGSQTKDLYSATRPRHFLLLRSISSSSQKNKLWFLRNMTRWYFELQKARTVAQIFTTFIFIRKMRKI